MSLISSQIRGVFFTLALCALLTACGGGTDASDSELDQTDLSPTPSEPVAPGPSAIVDGNVDAVVRPSSENSVSVNSANQIAHGSNQSIAVVPPDAGAAQPDAEALEGTENEGSNSQVSGFGSNTVISLEQIAPSYGISVGEAAASVFTENEPENPKQESENGLIESNTVVEQTSTSTEVVPENTGSQANAIQYSYPTAESHIYGIDTNSSTSVPGYRQTENGIVQGVTLTRVSDNSVFNLSNGKARHQYSKIQAWNINETLLDVGGKLIDAETYEIVRNYVPLSSARNWSNINPNLMYGIYYAPKANKFGVYNVETDVLTEIRSFGEYEECSLGEFEGNITEDDSKVVLYCENSSVKKLIAFDIKNNQILGEIEPKWSFNWAGYSQSGSYIIVENNPTGSTTPDDELIRYNADFSGEIKLTDKRAHGDFGYDDNGDDVFVMISWDYVFYVRLRDGARVNLASTGPEHHAGHGHISCRAVKRRGWCYASSMNESRVGAFKLGIPDSAEPIGKTFEDFDLYEGVASFELWGFHRSSSNEYAVQPKASVSPSGTRVIFTSDWYSNGEINDYVLRFEQ